MGLYPKLLLLVGSIFLLGGVVIIPLLYVAESTRIEQEGFDRAEMLAHTAFEALYASMSQGGGREGNRAIIERLRGLEGISEVRIVHGTPVARQFGNPDPDELPQDDLDRRALAGEEVFVVESIEGGRVVRHVTPLVVQPECQRYHQAEVGEVNGALSVRVSLEAYDAALEGRNRLLLTALGGGLLGLAAVTFIGVRRIVIVPVQTLRRAAETLTGGEFGHRVRPRTGDELEKLAAAFDTMAERLQASHVALAAQVHERGRTLMAVNAILSAISGGQDLDGVYRAFAEEIRQVVDFDRTSIILIEGEEAQVVAAATRAAISLSRGTRRPVAGTALEWLVRHKRARIEVDIRTAEEDFVARDLGLEEGIRSRLLVPILSRGEVVGALGFGSTRPDAYSEVDAERLRPLAGQLALAIENARLQEAVKRLSITDGLTGLFNRRYFDQRLAEERQRCLRYQRNFALMLLDIDHFKAFNDTYGHTAGDQVLAGVAATIRANVRDIDFVARYGGEEFAVILPEADEAEALRVAERVRAGVEARQFAQGRVTISVGIVGCALGMEIETLVNRADAALYESKHCGRNRVSLWHEQ